MRSDHLGVIATAPGLTAWTQAKTLPEASAKQRTGISLVEAEQSLAPDEAQQKLS